MKIGFLIIGRLKSTRLPKKILLDIHGKPVIYHMIQRLKLSTKIDTIILCTSINPQDKPLEKIAKDNDIECFLGDPDDVLLRMLNAAEKFNLDYILTITADCPFVDPFYADKIVEKYLEGDIWLYNYSKLLFEARWNEYKGQAYIHPKLPDFNF